MTIATLKSLLSSTGVAEPAGVEVGVRPNLLAAIQNLDNGPLVSPTITNVESCYQSNFLEWTQVSGATYYKLFLNGAFSKNVTHSSTTVNVYSYNNARVQACNSSNCSSNSNTVGVYFEPYCQ